MIILGPLNLAYDDTLFNPYDSLKTLLLQVSYIASDPNLNYTSLPFPTYLYYIKYSFEVLVSTDYPRAGAPPPDPLPTAPKTFPGD